MDQAYRRIFERCGLDAVPVDADSGAIGGAASQEFMVTAEAGEDLVLISDDGVYAANQEKAVSLASTAVPLDTTEAALPTGGLLIDTPGQVTIADLCAAQGWHPSQVVKVLLLLAHLEDGTDQPVLVSLRGDQELNDVKLINAISRLSEQGVLDCRPISSEALDQQGVTGLPLGSLSLIHI